MRHARMERYSNGQISYILCYREDQRHGPCKYFHENGQIRALGQYLEGRKTGRWLQYYYNGQLQMEENYEGGHLHGFARWYRLDGGKEYEACYTRGRKGGPFSEWHDSGERRISGYYRGGERHGLWLQWREGGELEILQRYSRGGTIPLGPEIEVLRHNLADTAGKERERLFGMLLAMSRDGMIITADEGPAPETETEFSDHDALPSVKQAMEDRMRILLDLPMQISGTAED